MSTEISIEENTPPKKEKKLSKRLQREKELKEKHALSGNQFALGNEGGRPIEYDKVALAKDLIEWAKKPDSFNLIGFASKIGVLREQLYEFAEVSEEFSYALKTARQRIVHNREIMLSNGTLHPHVYNRYAAVVDKELHKFERAEKEFDAMLKAKSESNVPQDQTALLNALLSQIKNLQDEVSARKIEESSKSNEQKS